MSSATETNPRGILLNHGKNHNSDHHNVTFTDKDQLILVEPLETLPDERERIINQVVPSHWKDEIELLKCKLKEENNVTGTNDESSDNNEKKQTDDKISN